MRYILFCLCPLLLFGDLKEDEALFLNRIADFWEEGEYEIARAQIHEFLSLYPNSSSSDLLSSAIGDLFLKEKNYAQALASYEKISDSKVIERIFPHKLQCLYALKMYENLADECERFLHEKDDIQITYYLAISLYQQSLNSNEKEQLLARAEPYFEKLNNSPLKGQIAALYAHLLCMQKNFPKAANIYLELGTEEMLFQAALIQAEYDKEASLKTFNLIKSSKPDYAYNCLVLSFDLKKYEDILQDKDVILQTIPQTKIPMAHLFFGRSLFALHRYSESIRELEQYLIAQTTVSETLHSALLTQLECAIQSKDLEVAEKTIGKIASFYPEDDAIVKGKISIALILRETNQLESAKQELIALPKTTTILLELSYICNQLNDWTSAREYAYRILENEPENILAKKYFVYASAALANLSTDGKKQFIEDLIHLADPSFHFLLAKTYFNLHVYEKALPLLLEVPENEDANLMIALCYRDGFHDLQNFCLYGEKVLYRNNSKNREFGKEDPQNFCSQQASIAECQGVSENKNYEGNPMPPKTDSSGCFGITGDMHLALYNAYLELEDIEKAASHLYTAFQMKIPISYDNLFWLAERFIAKANTNDAIIVLESMNDKKPEAILALSKIYHQNGRNGEAAALLESIPDLNEAALLLGEIYAKEGKIEEAKTCFAKVCQDTSSLKTFVGASACLQNIRLQQPSVEVLNQYKNLILQKNILFEPLYLEAALDYVTLQTQQHGNDLEKKIALLRKTKRDFENSEDLLSKDYHAAKEANHKQNAIYQSYMSFFDAELLEAQSQLESDSEEQKALHAKAKDILLKIVEEQAHPALVERANQCLNH